MEQLYANNRGKDGGAAGGENSRKRSWIRSD